MQMSASIDQLAVNHLVAGSSPARGANTIKHLTHNALSAFLFRVTPGSQTASLVDRFSLSIFLRTNSMRQR